MASIKISELEEVVELTNSDVLPIINENETKKVSFEKLMENTATKEYVDNLTTKSKIVKYITWGKGENVTGDYPADEKTTMGELITESIANWMTATCYTTIILDGDYGIYTMLEPFVIKSKYLKYIFYEYGGVRRQYDNKYCMIVEGSWNGSKFECSTLRREVRVDYLTKDNTEAYTPTADYHPATKKYVDEHAGSGGSANVDLSNYYTKEETNSAISTNLSNYSTTTQMDKALATKQPLLTAGENITIDENNVISASGGSSGDAVPTIVWSGATDADAVAQIQKWVDYYNATGAFLPIYMSKGNNDTFTDKVQCLTTLGTYLKNNTNYTIGIYGISELDSHFNKDIYVKLTTLSVRFTDNTRTTVSSIAVWGGADHRLALNYNGSSDASQNGCLAVTNVKEYTPTSDYHPATKKYVDDAITSAITSVMEAEY